jgi:hypothetical protein
VKSPMGVAKKEGDYFPGAYLILCYSRPLDSAERKGSLFSSWALLGFSSLIFSTGLCNVCTHGPSCYN